MYFLLDVCRLCLSYKNEFYDLCSDDIMEKLVTCIADLEFEDHIPSVICEKCLDQVDLYYEFRNKCLRSEFIINNYVETLLGGSKNSQLRSKFQVKVSRSFSPTKFPSNVKLSPPTLLSNSSLNTFINKKNFEDLQLDGVHTDITERVKLRKRCQAKRSLSIRTENQETEKSDSSVNVSGNEQLIENIPIEQVHQANQDVAMHPEEPVEVLLAPQNVPLVLNQSPIISVFEKYDSNEICEIIGVSPFKSSSPTTSHLECTQTSIQSNNCHLQAPINSNYNSTESSFASINLKHELAYQPADSNQTYSEEAPVTSKQNISVRNLHQLYLQEMEVNSNQDVLFNKNGGNNEDDIDVEEPQIYEIEDDDAPDDIKQMIMLNSILSRDPSKLLSRKSSIKTPIQPKRHYHTSKDYIRLNTSTHISTIEHNYSGQILLPSRKKFKATIVPTFDSSSSSSDESKILDVERVSDDEKVEPPCLAQNVVKCINERNRRKRLRTYFEDLIYALPPDIGLERQSKVSILNKSEIYIKSLENEISQNIDKVLTLKEKNLQLKERLKEITKQR